LRRALSARAAAGEEVLASEERTYDARAPAMEGGEGGGAEEGVGESSSPPRAPAPALVPAASGGSGGSGGGGGTGGRELCRVVFKRLVADGHVEAVGATSGPELRAQLEAHFARLPVR
jgi:hypothetical protein